MITIFSNPRPFEGLFNLIQRNAIKSWINLYPDCEIILFEDENKTTLRVAAELDPRIKVIENVECNEFGTALMSDVFKKIRAEAKGDIICQVNTDIILLRDFINSIEDIREVMGDKNFFMSGRRWDMDVKDELNAEDADFEKHIRKLIKEKGSLHGYCGMDYWIFPRKYNLNMPPMVIGRPGIDSWIVYKTRALKYPVIDSTASITALHQNHNYPRKKSESFEKEKRENISLAGALNMLTLQDANWVFDGGKIKKPPFPRAVFSALSLFYPWKLFRGLRQNFRRIK